MPDMAGIPDMPGMPDIPGVMPDWNVADAGLAAVLSGVWLEQDAMSRTLAAASGIMTFTPRDRRVGYTSDFSAAARRIARCCNTFALAMVMPIWVAASLIEQPCRKRSSRISR